MSELNCPTEEALIKYYAELYKKAKPKAGEVKEFNKAFKKMIK